MIIEPSQQGVIPHEQLSQLQLKIKPLLNNKELELEDFDKFEIEVDSNLDGKLSKKDNYWIYDIDFVQSSWGFNNPQGKNKFIVDLINENENEKTKLNEQITIEIEELGFWNNWGKLILTIIAIIITIICIIGYIRKPRFSKNAKIKFREVDDEYNRERSFNLKANILNSITPFIPHRMKVRNVEFIASELEKLNVSSKDIDALCAPITVKRVEVDGKTIEKDLSNKNKKQKIVNYTIRKEKSIKVIYNDKKYEEYFYSCGRSDKRGKNKK